MLLVKRRSLCFCVETMLSFPFISTDVDFVVPSMKRRMRKEGSREEGIPISSILSHETKYEERCNCSCKCRRILIMINDYFSSLAFLVFCFFRFPLITSVYLLLWILSLQPFLWLLSLLFCFLAFVIDSHHLYPFPPPDAIFFHSYAFFPFRVANKCISFIWWTLFLPSISFISLFWWLCNGCYDGDHDDDASTTIQWVSCAFDDKLQWTHLQSHAPSQDPSSSRIEEDMENVVNQCQALTPASTTVDSSSDSKLVLISQVQRVEVSITLLLRGKKTTFDVEDITLFLSCTSFPYFFHPVFFSHGIFVPSFAIMSWEEDTTFCSFISRVSSSRSLLRSVRTLFYLSFCSKELKLQEHLEQSREYWSCCYRRRRRRRFRSSFRCPCLSLCKKVERDRQENRKKDNTLL